MKVNMEQILLQRKLEMMHKVSLQSLQSLFQKKKTFNDLRIDKILPVVVSDITSSHNTRRGSRGCGLMLIIKVLNCSTSLLTCGNM